MHRNLYQVSFILILAASAAGQDALGRGDALDSSTSSLGRENLPSGVRNNEIRGYNVMYGNGFNSAIGRSNSAEMNILATAANKGSKAYLDAINNSPWYWNNWDKQSTQFLIQGDTSYFNPRFIDNWSSAPQLMESGRKIRTYSHDWTEEGAKKYADEGDSPYPDQWSNRQVDQYQLGQALGSGYQTPSVDTSPLQVGIYQSEKGTGYLAASPLIGVALETSSHPTTAIGLSAWDAARASEDARDGIAPSTLVNAWRTEENRLDLSSSENRVSIPDQYTDILQTIANRAEEEVKESKFLSNINLLNDRYSELQDKLLGIRDEEEIVYETGETEDDAIDEIAGALRHGETISQLSSKYQTRFDELVQLGEDELEKGAFFLAGQRFDQALRLIPGQPLATAGLGHSNIGAGLYLSAGHVLQSLLSFQPEMIDVVYEPQLLPPKIDLVRAGVAIQSRLDEKKDGGTYAFLLAYIGHQLDDIDMIRKGLSVLEKRTDENDTLVPLLKLIWLDKINDEQQELPVE
ncbi:MAG: hypothetical protein QF718_02440 [Phycisphaerales bacterium]|nr:hypothetical protein [Phycisphaerales bacterium]